MRYEVPESVEHATRLLEGEPGLCRVLAGGTDIIVQMHGGNVEPDLIVDVKRLPGFQDITEEDGGYRIGAAVPCAALGEHEGLAKSWPGVVEAAGLIGSTQIQGRATITGNLCNASPAADSVPALIAADAMATIAGPSGRRTMAVAEIPTGPGKTALGRGEIIESIFLPSRPARSGDAYLRFIPRTEMDIAVVGAGVSLTLDAAGTCSAARVALGAVAATAIQVPEAAALLVGSTAEGLDQDAFAAAVSKACRPIDDKRGTKAFRTKVAGVMARRAAMLAFERAGGMA